MIVAAGVLFLLEHLGMLGGYAAWAFWPVILIVMGIEAMFRSYKRLFGVTLALAGTLLLVWSLALAPIQWSLVWPLLLIGFGVFLVIRIMTRKRHVPRVPDFAKDLPPGSVMMGSKEERIDSQDYQGSEVSTVMGAYQLDLSAAEMQVEKATVFAKAVMGAVEIIVPRHWRVVVQGTPVLGAIENKTREPSDPDRTLVIVAEVVLGGIEIRN